MKHFRWDKKYLYWGVTAFCVIAACIIFYWLLQQGAGVAHIIVIIWKALTPFIYGILIAYVLDRVMVFFENALFRKLGKRLHPNSEPAARRSARIFAIVATHLLALGLVAGILIMVMPQLYYSIQSLVSKSSTYINVVVAWADNFFKGSNGLEANVQSWLQSFSSKIAEWTESKVLPQMSNIVSSVTGGIYTFVKGIVNVLIGVVISVYIMYHKETFRAQGKKWIYSVMKPRAANRVMDELSFINSAFGNFVTGEIIDSLIVGVANYIFMLIMGMPYSALISILMCVTNLIPMFGPFIGAVPSAVLLVLESPMQALAFIIYTIVSQQIDGNVLKPQIHGSRAGISGFWIMFAILFFGGLFGVWGMLLGVPLLTVLYDAVRRRNANRLRARGLPEETNEYLNIYRINPETNRPVYVDRDGTKHAGEGPQQPRWEDKTDGGEDDYKDDPGD